MRNLITIRTFTYAHETAVVRGKLESEGIESFVQDDLMAQVNPLYSNAIGGIKLQVRERDAEQALEILKEGGYINEGDNQPSTYMVKFDKATSTIPLLKDMPIEIRLAIAGTVIILAVLTLLYFIL